MKYRQRLQTVEALRFTGKLTDFSRAPRWFQEAMFSGQIIAVAADDYVETHLRLPVGVVHVGDWIVKDHNGFVPMSQSLFSTLYEREEA
jgi:hypothetical protein